MAKDQTNLACTELTSILFSLSLSLIDPRYCQVTTRARLFYQKCGNTCDHAGVT